MCAEKRMISFQSIPVDGPLRITSGFGPRNTGIPGASTYHKGNDLGRDTAKSETKILAVASGTVSKSYWNDFRGWVTVIDHNGFSTLYQHLKYQGLPAGTHVEAGQVIGIMGNSSNPEKLKVTEHLHFELLVDGVPVDPAAYLMNIRKEELELTEAEVRAIVKSELTAWMGRMGISEANGDKPSQWAEPFWKWGMEKGITDGSKPGGLCTREQVVTMLYKLDQLKK